MILEEFIKKSPKAELHLHIEGTLEPELMFSLAKRNNIKIPFKNINDVRQGKFLELNLDEMEVQAAHDLVDKMCTKLLANVVIEDYRIDLDI